MRWQRAGALVVVGGVVLLVWALFVTPRRTEATRDGPVVPSSAVPSPPQVERSASTSSPALFPDAGTSVPSSSVGRDRLRTALQRATGAYRDGVESSPPYAAYLACLRASGPEECGGLLDRAMWFTIYRSFFGALDDDEFGLLAETDALGWEAANEVWTAAFDDAPDAVERVALLAARSRDRNLRGAPLEDSLVLPHIAGDSIPESALLLEMVADDNRARSAARAEALRTNVVAADYDSRLRERALRALGHPSSSADLISAVEAMRSNPAHLSELRLPLGMALSRCGAACDSTVEDLLTSDDPALQELQSLLRRRRGE